MNWVGVEKEGGRTHEKVGVERVNWKAKAKMKTGHKQGDLASKVSIVPLSRPGNARSLGRADAIAVTCVGQAVAPQHRRSIVRKFGIRPRANPGTGRTDRFFVGLGPDGCRPAFPGRACGRLADPCLLPNGKPGCRLPSRVCLTGAADGSLRRRGRLVAATTNPYAR